MPDGVSFSIERLHEEIDKVYPPFKEFISKFPGVFSLRYSESEGYLLGIDHTYLKLLWDTQADVVE